MLEWMPINFAIIKNPVNWLTVFVIALIGMFAWHELVKAGLRFGLPPAVTSSTAQKG